MRRFASIVVAGALVLGCTSPGVGPSEPAREFVWDRPVPLAPDVAVVDRERLHRFELSNGLRVLVLVDHKLPAIDMGLTVPRGIAIEAPEQAGIANFTAELMQRGAGGRDALALAQAVDSLGGSMSVSAGWDAIDASVGGLSRDRAALFEVLSDVVQRPALDEEEAARVRTAQLARLRQAGDDPGTLVAWTFYETLYPGLRAGLPASGTEASVAALTAEAAAAFHRRVFTPDRAILWAAGDVSAEDFRAEAEAAFGSWSGPAVADPAPELPQTGPRRIIVVDRPELGQAQIAIGHDGIARTDPDRLELQLVNTVLGAAGFSSRLMVSVRAEEGLTYSIGSRFSQRRTGGNFAVTTFAEAGRVGDLLALVMAELERIRTEPPDATEIGWAKSLRTGRFALALETSGAVAGSLVDLEVYDLPRDTIDTYRGRVRALEPDAPRCSGAARHPPRTALHRGGRASRSPRAPARALRRGGSPRPLTVGLGRAGWIALRDRTTRPRQPTDRSASLKSSSAKTDRSGGPGGRAPLDPSAAVWENVHA